MNLIEAAQQALTDYNNDRLREQRGRAQDYVGERRAEFEQYVRSIFSAPHWSGVGIAIHTVEELPQDLMMTANDESSDYEFIQWFDDSCVALVTIDAVGIHPHRWLLYAQRPDVWDAWVIGESPEQAWDDGSVYCDAFEFLDRWVRHASTVNLLDDMLTGIGLHLVEPDGELGQLQELASESA